jgi:hypothetical protein
VPNNILTTAALLSFLSPTLYLLTLVMVAILAGKGGKKKHFEDEGELWTNTLLLFICYGHEIGFSLINCSTRRKSARDYQDA